MKQIVSNYTYSPTANAVTLTGLNIDADQLLLIVAPEVGRTLYNFAAVTGSVVAGSDTRVNLNASTAGLTTTSPLVIFYDDQIASTTVTGTVALDNASLVALENITVTGGLTDTQLRASAVTISGTVTVGSINLGEQAGFVGGGYDNLEQLFGSTSLAVGSLPAISGTVTANLSSTNLNAVTIGVRGTVTVGNSITIGSLPAISGTVTVGNSINISQFGVGIPAEDLIYDDGTTQIQARITSAVTLPISGTVTVGAMPNGALTTRFGTPTTASSVFATSAVTNASRKYLLIQNVTTQSNVITVGIGFTPTTTQGIQLTAGAGITFESSYIPTGAVQILSSVTASNFTILEA